MQRINKSRPVYKDQRLAFYRTFMPLFFLMVMTLHSVVKPVSAGFCPPLPAPTGAVITVSTEAAIRDQAYNAAANTTIKVVAGVYQMQGFVQIVHDGVVLRGATGNRDDVVLDFGGMTGGYFGTQIEGDDVTIANLTIRNANDHGVSVQSRDRPVLYNLHIIDIGDQLVKVNPPMDGSNGSDNGLLACCRLEYTTSAPDDYTNGISAHRTHNWVVRDNEWLRIRGNANECGPAILFWSQSTGTIIERNLLINCFRGISFGDSSHSGVDHTGGIVRNNFIYSEYVHDTAIEMVHAQDWLVAHNSVMLLNPVSGLDWGMEARFSDSQGNFAYNLTNMRIWNDRDGATATLSGNVTNAQTNWFVDNAANGNLHLAAGATAAIDQASPLAEVNGDIDGDPRDASPDIGADELCSAGPGDLDSNCIINLKDAILALQVTVGSQTAVNQGGDVNTDAKINLAEAIYILEKLAGLR